MVHYANHVGGPLGLERSKFGIFTGGAGVEREGGGGRVMDGVVRPLLGSWPTKCWKRWMSMFLSWVGECAREWRGGEREGGEEWEGVGEPGCGDREGESGNGVG